MSEWSGKVALVTGGTRGIGRAVAHRFSRLGLAVVVTGRDPGRSKQAAGELSEGATTAVVGVAMDVADRSSVGETIKQIVEDKGRIDILVNNAGVTRNNLLMRMKSDDWDAVMSTNVNGTYYCSQAVLRPMIRQRYGRIISMSSVVGSMGNPGQSNYAASKAAIVGFSKALAREVASRQITVNVVAPGFIDTDMTRELSADQKKALDESIPMRRIGAPEDVAAAVEFLASEDAGYITGHVLHVNGGLYM